MAITDWIQTAAVIYFAWQQNRIFKRQNEIFANQTGQTAMQSNTSQLFKVLERYWPTVVMVGLMVLTGYDIYYRHANGVFDPNVAPIPLWWHYGPLLLLVAAGIGLMIGRFTRANSHSGTSAELAEQLRDIRKQIPSIMVNGVPIAGPAAQLLPNLRARTIAVCEELRAFLKEHGPDPEFKHLATEDAGDYLARVLAIRTARQERLSADYRLKLGESVRRIRDEITVRSGMSELGLDSAIERAESNLCDVEAVKEINKHFWKLAGTMTD
jgi:hypothetical protein